MITVIGTHDQVPYQVGVHDEPPEGNDFGCVMGSTHITALLYAHVGDETKRTPTSDPLVLTLDDPASVLAYLTEYTDIDSIEGDVPNEPTERTARY